MRLIDADALKYQVYLSKNRNSHSNPNIAKTHEYEHTHFIHMINDAPTVLTVEMPKDGKWQRAIGYATGGGDPCWKCPCCGGSIHVKGIEHPDPHPKYCKDCGARIEGEEW